MPVGNAEKNNMVRNVRYFDLAEAYRKKEAARIRAEEEKKETENSGKGNKKTPEKEGLEPKSVKKKKPDESVLKNISFKDLNRISIGESKAEE